MSSGATKHEQFLIQQVAKSCSDFVWTLRYKSQYTDENARHAVEQARIKVLGHPGSKLFESWMRMIKHEIIQSHPELTTLNDTDFKDQFSLHFRKRIKQLLIDEISPPVISMNDIRFDFMDDATSTDDTNNSHRKQIENIVDQDGSDNYFLRYMAKVLEPKISSKPSDDAIYDVLCEIEEQLSKSGTNILEAYFPEGVGDALDIVRSGILTQLFIVELESYNVFLHKY